MEQKPTQLQHTLKYSLYSGGIIVFYLFLLFVTGRANNTRLLNVAAFIFVGGAYLSVRHYRDRVRGGSLDFGKAYGTSVLTCVFSGIIWSAYTFVLYRYLLPELLLERMELAQEMYLNLGMSEEMVELLSTQITPFNMAFGNVFSAAFWGSLISLLIAAMLKRDVNPLTDRTS
jgi:riboflavin transporter FmnP